MTEILRRFLSFVLIRFIAENECSHSAVLTGIRGAIVDSSLVEGTCPAMTDPYKGVATFATGTCYKYLQPFLAVIS